MKCRQTISTVLLSVAAYAVIAAAPAQAATTTVIYSSSGHPQGGYYYPSHRYRECSRHARWQQPYPVAYYPHPVIRYNVSPYPVYRHPPRSGHYSNHH